MVSAAEQMAANTSWSALGKATDLRNRILFTLGYQVLERVGAPEMSANDAVAFMGVGWMAGQLLATWRYRKNNGFAPCASTSFAHIATRSIPIVVCRCS